VVRKKISTTAHALHAALCRTGAAVLVVAVPVLGLFALVGYVLEPKTELSIVVALFVAWMLMGSLAYLNMWLFYGRLRKQHPAEYMRATEGHSFTTQMGFQFGPIELHGCASAIAATRGSKFSKELRSSAAFVRILNLFWFALGLIVGGVGLWRAT
jgi:4-amino-4-deoxy-L-arabinose transferase-like glycosyltransferase